MQTKFGGDESKIEELGNCWAACIATIIEEDLDNVPHFYGTDRVNNDTGDCWSAAQRWLWDRGYSLICFEYTVKGISDILVEGYRNTPCIITGKSQRFSSVNHAVVGMLNQDGSWTLLHDPHPDGTGIDGEPVIVEFITKRIETIQS